jgi:glutaryl-CoA dehydrogenase
MPSAGPERRDVPAERTASRPTRKTSTASEEPPVLGGPEHTDYYRLDELLTDEQRALRRRVREFMDREVLLIINPV